MPRGAFLRGDWRFLQLTLAVIEATVGQFYVAVIVAVFVGMYATQRRDA
jgi:hypothetical protein